MIKPTINTFFAHHNISVWLLLFMFSFPAHAQSITIVRSSIGHNIGSSLQTHTEPQYNAQYVVGQLIASSSISVDNYKIAHGFIQPLIWGESLSDYTDDIFWDIELVTFPNPVFQNLFVHVKGQSNSSIRILIYDSFGRVVLRDSYPMKDTSIDVSTLAAGTFLLQARIGAKTIMKQFVKRTYN